MSRQTHHVGRAVAALAVASCAAQAGCHPALADSYVDAVCCEVTAATSRARAVEAALQAPNGAPVADGPTPPAASRTGRGSFLGRG